MRPLTITAAIVLALAPTFATAATPRPLHPEPPRWEWACKPMFKPVCRRLRAYYAIIVATAPGQP